MFSTALAKPGQGSHGFAAVYAQVGVETGVTSASPHKLVQMLFDGLLDALRQATLAMHQGDAARKGRELSLAGRILEEGLKSGLNLSQGGDLAHKLYDLYSYIEIRLMHAHLRNDPAAIDEAVRLLIPLREAWMAIEALADSRPGH